jgi:glycerate kinase
VRLAAASDVDVPLLGFHGASAGFAAQKGATPEQAQALEAALGRFAQVAQESLGVLAGGDLLSPGSAPRRLPSTPGAGAAGGLGFGLLLLGAERVGGASAVLDAVDFDRRIAATDLVVTGEGKFDWQSLRGKVVSAVAERALAVGVPTIVIAGQVDAGRRESLAIGIESSYAVAESVAELQAALADPAGTLAARARRVARTWSR